ncbi:hypothetical protein [Oceanobacillus sp. J11TS1]|uniref:hypothetical protein n=1 Tax=Oceanobacillus sp. J11TS1 TaxID=2807191 RepID=UPI001B0021E0|nr:hypothetical protein [Oceanobacillus sp. J11TS1]GIO21495.1 hypothetical protein J11TS1_00760 [Oceanobacillus sp. J11TS1]
MFQDRLIDQLPIRIGAGVEIATDNNLIEGTLSLVIGGLIFIISISSYGIDIRLIIPLNSINFIRFPAAA